MMKSFKQVKTSMLDKWQQNGINPCYQLSSYSCPISIQANSVKPMRSHTKQLCSGDIIISALWCDDELFVHGPIDTSSELIQCSQLRVVLPRRVSLLLKTKRNTNIHAPSCYSSRFNCRQICYQNIIIL